MEFYFLEFTYDHEIRILSRLYPTEKMSAETELGFNAKAYDMIAIIALSDSDYSISEVKTMSFNVRPPQGVKSFCTARHRVIRDINTGSVQEFYDMKVKHVNERGQGISVAQSTEIMLNREQYESLLRSSRIGELMRDSFTRVEVRLSPYITATADIGHRRNRAEIDITSPYGTPRINESVMREFYQLIMQSSNKNPINMIISAVSDLKTTSSLRSSMSKFIPHNISMKYLTYGGIVGNTDTAYTATFKADGEHVFICTYRANSGLNQSMIGVMIGYSGEIKAMWVDPYGDGQIRSETIIEGELIEARAMQDGRSQMQFMPFDCIMHDGDNISKLAFHQRIKIAEQVIAELKSLDNIDFAMKEFRSFESAEQFYNVMEDMLTRYEDSAYPLDGIIFIPRDLAYDYRVLESRPVIYLMDKLVQNVTPTNLRWKPLDKLTIDLYLEADGSLSYTGRVGKENRNMNIKNIEQFKNMTVNLTGYMPGSVIEFGIDIPNQRLVPHRVREDKENPNKESSIMSTYRLAEDPLTEQLMMGKTNRLLRKHHNDVKRAMFRTSLKRSVIRPVLLDLGSGNGGDMTKMMLDAQTYSHIYLVEPDLQNLTELRTRLSKMPEQFKRVVTVIHAAAQDTDKIMQVMGNRRATTVSMMLSLTFFTPSHVPNAHSLPTMADLARTIRSAAAPNFELLVITMDRTRYNTSKHMLRPGAALTTIQQLDDNYISIRIEDSIVRGQVECLVTIDDLISEIGGSVTSKTNKFQTKNMGEMTVGTPNRLLNEDEIIINSMYDAQILEIRSPKQMDRLSASQGSRLPSPSRVSALPSAIPLPSVTLSSVPLPSPSRVSALPSAIPSPSSTLSSRPAALPSTARPSPGRIPASPSSVPLPSLTLPSNIMSRPAPSPARSSVQLPPSRPALPPPALSPARSSVPPSRPALPSSRPAPSLPTLPSSRPALPPPALSPARSSAPSSRPGPPPPALPPSRPAPPPALPSSRPGPPPATLPPSRPALPPSTMTPSTMPSSSQTFVPPPQAAASRALSSRSGPGIIDASRISSAVSSSVGSGMTMNIVQPPSVDSTSTVETLNTGVIEALPPLVTVTTPKNLIIEIKNSYRLGLDAREPVLSAILISFIESYNRTSAMNRVNIFESLISDFSRNNISVIAGIPVNVIMVKMTSPTSGTIDMQRSINNKARLSLMIFDYGNNNYSLLIEVAAGSYGRDATRSPIIDPVNYKIEDILGRS